MQNCCWQNSTITIWIEISKFIFEMESKNERIGISSNLHGPVVARKVGEKSIKCANMRTAEHWKLNSLIVVSIARRACKWCNVRLIKMLSIVLKMQNKHCHIYAMVKKAVLWSPCLHLLENIRQKKETIRRSLFNNRLTPKGSILACTTKKNNCATIISIAIRVLIQCKVAHLDKLHHAPASLPQSLEQKNQSARPFFFKFITSTFLARLVRSVSHLAVYLAVCCCSLNQ